MFALFMGLKTISPSGLHEMMQKQAVTILDINSSQL